MNKRATLFLFTASLAANIVGGFLDDPWIEYLSKPLIVVSLTAYFVFETRGARSPLKKWILLALLFSWLGDVLLMFQKTDELFFLLGLSAFLLAHIFYIIFFHRVKTLENVKSTAWLMVPVVLYYLGLISFLSPHLSEMKLPVRVYGLVISFMFLLSLHMLFIRNKTPGRFMLAGAALFVISDSVLAINKFYYSFAAGSLIIMLTYGAAQFFIAEGAARYINSGHKE